MELIVLVAVVVGGVVMLARATKLRGTETVRAHIFLMGQTRSKTEAEANRAADVDVESGPTELIHDAMLHLNAKYAGKQTRMIAAAYKRGMKPKLPKWYQSLYVTRLDGEDRLQDATAIEQPILDRATATYEDYEAFVINEVKRLEGMDRNALHWIELLDHEGTRHAFADGVNPLALARWLIAAGPPPSSNHPAP